MKINTQKNLKRKSFEKKKGKCFKRKKIVYYSVGWLDNIFLLRVLVSYCDLKISRRILTTRRHGQTKGMEAAETRQLHKSKVAG